MATTRHKGACSKKQQPEIGLYMECEDEDLSPAQKAAFNKDKASFQSFNKKMEDYLKRLKGKLVVDEGDYFLFEVNHTPPPPPPPPPPPAPTPAFPANQSKAIIVVVPQTQQVAAPLQISPKATVGRSLRGSPATPNPPLRSLAPKLTVRTRRGAKQADSEQAPISPTAVVSASVSPISPPVTRGTRSSRQLSPPPLIEATPPTTAVTPPETSANLYITKKTGHAQASSVKASESSALGGLTAGTKNVKNAPLNTLINIYTDCKEVPTGKNGKTFPSLAVVARPHLISKTAAVNAQMERASLDVQVKGVLMLTPAKLTVWLIQQGLLKGEGSCSIHLTKNRRPVRHKLGMYNDVSKFPYSGGYVWISDCCPTVYISVFHGSIFEGAPHPPTVMLKLLYHWACQTNVQNVVQWVKVEPLYVKNVYTILRAVCVEKVREKYGKIGGSKRKVEIGLISLGTSAQDSSLRQVKVEVLGVMEPETNLIRLRAIEPSVSETKNARKRFAKILQPIAEWVDKDSQILMDYSLDKDTLMAMGFSNILQSHNGSEKPRNGNIMGYLRRIVPKVFNNMLWRLSRSIIQQFLDELVWRERWGPIAAKAFNSLIADIADLTKKQWDEGLVTKLLAIAENPFDDAESEEEVIQVSPTVKRSPRKRHAEVEPSEEAASTSQETYPPPKRVTREKDKSKSKEQPETAKEKPKESPRVREKRMSLRNKEVKEKESVEEEKYWIEQTIDSEISAEALVYLNEEEIAVDSYYYGTLKGKPSDLEIVDEKTNKIKCSICLRTLNGCLELSKHLQLHIQTKPPIPSDFRKIQQCPQCFIGFPSLISLETHKEATHILPENKSHLICHICEKLFVDRHQLIFHMHRTHVAVEMPYVCGVCHMRSSSYNAITDHFMADHHQHLQCRYCFKTVDVLSNGDEIENNVIFFTHHLYRHARQGDKIKCHRCKLSFVNNLVLQRHLEVDHASFSLNTDVEPIVFTSSDSACKMPEPGNLIKPILIPKHLDSAPSESFNVTKFSEPLKISAEMHHMCVECEAPLLASTCHFVGDLHCAKCKYQTCCPQAMHEHVAVFHDHEQNFPTPEHPKLLGKTMFCECGFSSCSGNRLAKHLARCGKSTGYPYDLTARPSRQKARRSGGRPFTTKGKSTGEPTMLNMLGLVRKSPEPVEATPEERDEIAENLSRLFHGSVPKESSEVSKDESEVSTSVSDQSATKVLSDEPMEMLTEVVEPSNAVIKTSESDITEKAQGNQSLEVEAIDASSSDQAVVDKEAEGTDNKEVSATNIEDKLTFENKPNLPGLDISEVDSNKKESTAVAETINEDVCKESVQTDATLEKSTDMSIVSPVCSTDKTDDSGTVENNQSNSHLSNDEVVKTDTKESSLRDDVEKLPNSEELNESSSRNICQDDSAVCDNIFSVQKTDEKKEEVVISNEDPKESFDEAGCEDQAESFEVEKETLKNSSVDSTTISDIALNTLEIAVIVEKDIGISHELEETCDKSNIPKIEEKLIQPAQSSEIIDNVEGRAETESELELEEKEMNSGKSCSEMICKKRKLEDIDPQLTVDPQSKKNKGDSEVVLVDSKEECVIMEGKENVGSSSFVQKEKELSDEIFVGKMSDDEVISLENSNSETKTIKDKSEDAQICEEKGAENSMDNNESSEYKQYELPDVSGEEEEKENASENELLPVETATDIVRDTEREALVTDSENTEEVPKEKLEACNLNWNEEENMDNEIVAENEMSSKKLNEIEMNQDNNDNDDSLQNSSPYEAETEGKGDESIETTNLETETSVDGSSKVQHLGKVDCKEDNERISSSLDVRVGDEEMFDSNVIEKETFDDNSQVRKAIDEGQLNLNDFENVMETENKSATSLEEVKLTPNIVRSGADEKEVSPEVIEEIFMDKAVDSSQAEGVAEECKLDSEIIENESLNKNTSSKEENIEDRDLDIVSDKEDCEFLLGEIDLQNKNSDSDFVDKEAKVQIEVHKTSEKSYKSEAVEGTIKSEKEGENTTVSFIVEKPMADLIVSETNKIVEELEIDQDLHEEKNIGSKEMEVESSIEIDKSDKAMLSPQSTHADLDIRTEVELKPADIEEVERFSSECLERVIDGDVSDASQNDEYLKENNQEEEKIADNDFLKEETGTTTVDKGETEDKEPPMAIVHPRSDAGFAYCSQAAETGEEKNLNCDFIEDEKDSKIVEKQLNITEDEKDSKIVEKQLNVTEDEKDSIIVEKQLNAIEDEKGSNIVEEQLNAIEDEKGSKIVEEQLNAIEDEKGSKIVEEQLNEDKQNDTFSAREIVIDSETVSLDLLLNQDAKLESVDKITKADENLEQVQENTVESQLNVDCNQSEIESNDKIESLDKGKPALSLLSSEDGKKAEELIVDQDEIREVEKDKLESSAQMLEEEEDDEFCQSPSAKDDDLLMSDEDKKEEVVMKVDNSIEETLVQVASSDCEKSVITEINICPSEKEVNLEVMDVDTMDSQIDTKIGNTSLPTESNIDTQVDADDHLLLIPKTFENEKLDLNVSDKDTKTKVGDTSLPQEILIPKLNLDVKAADIENIELKDESNANTEGSGTDTHIDEFSLQEKSVELHNPGSDFLKKQTDMLDDVFEKKETEETSMKPDKLDMQEKSKSGDTSKEGNILDVENELESKNNSLDRKITDDDKIDHNVAITEAEMEIDAFDTLASDERNLNVSNKISDLNIVNTATATDYQIESETEEFNKVLDEKVATEENKQLEGGNLDCEMEKFPEKISDVEIEDKNAEYEPKSPAFCTKLESPQSDTNAGVCNEKAVEEDVKNESREGESCFENDDLLGSISQVKSDKSNILESINVTLEKAVDHGNQCELTKKCSAVDDVEIGKSSEEFGENKEQNFIEVEQTGNINLVELQGEASTEASIEHERCVEGQDLEKHLDKEKGKDNLQTEIAENSEAVVKSDVSALDNSKEIANVSEDACSENVDKESVEGVNDGENEKKDGDEIAEDIVPVSEEITKS